MDIKDLTIILLIGRILSIIFIGLVIKRQLKLFKVPIEPELKSYRLTLFQLSLVVLLGNLLTGAIDVATLISVDSLSREISPSTYGIIYRVVGMLTAVASSYLIWTLYRQAAKTVVLVDRDKKEALKKKN